MDDTKGTGQDTSPGGSGQSPGSKSGTPKDKGKLYTVAAIAKIKSDAATMSAGREKKVADQEKSALTQELQSTKSRLDALESEVNESRLAEARGDPEKLRIYQREQAIAKRERAAADKERDVAKREAQLKADRADVDKDKGVVNIATLAAEHGLEPEELEDLGITDHDQLEKVAKKLAAAKGAGPGKGKDADREAYEALETDAERASFTEAHPDFEVDLEPDSGKTTGGAGPLTIEQREKMPMAEYAERVAKETSEK